MIRKTMFGLLLCTLAACSSSSDVWTPPAQQWQAFQVKIETRPEVLRDGMNEFVVIVDRQGKKHIPDLLVKIRTSSSKWKQAMPDGALGIYRRALMVRDVQHEQLYVRLSYHGKEGALTFDLSPTHITAD